MDEVDAYKSREPGPYWPDSGNSHMTCKTLVVALVAAPVALRLTRVPSTAVNGSAGIVNSIEQRSELKVGPRGLSICSSQGISLATE